MGVGGSGSLFNYDSREMEITSGKHRTALSTTIDSYLDRYEIFIVALYFPHNQVLRQYLCTHLNHLDALTGEKILLVSFDYPNKDADELIDMWVERLGNEHEQEIKERVNCLKLDERTIYNIADSCGVAYSDLPCC